MYYQQYTLAHICHAYRYEYVYAYAAAYMYIEMGPTQTSEGKERFPAR